tara:strand:+ start:4450 stop:5352 length:903 start_codon:yes stop_codon:yes gene_type:complete
MSTPKELIISTKNFNPADVTFAPAKVDARGGKKVQLLINGAPIVLRTPPMFTWGVNERVDEASARVSYDCSIVFEQDKSNAITQFREKLQQMQDIILEAASNGKSKEWFGKAKMSKEVAEAMMYPILKFPKNKDSGEEDFTRNPSVTIKLPYWEDEFAVELYDMKGKALFLPPVDGGETPQGDNMPTDIVPSKSNIQGLIQCNGVWMAGGRFGVTWKLLQAQVKAPVRLVGMGVCHIMADSDDEDEDEDDGAVVEATQSIPESKVGDDVAKEIAVETAVAAAVTKKKVVRRKKKEESTAD